MRDSRNLSVDTVLHVVGAGIAILGFALIAATAINAWAAPAPTTVIFDNDQQTSSSDMTPASMVDPQGRVGRISLIDGTVSSHTPDQDAWTYATLNYPVVSGNSFWTEPNAKAEIQIGSDAIRMDGGTEIDINELDDKGTRIEISQGAVNLHVGDVEKGEIYQIITPHETINLLQPGTYRVKTGGPNSNAADEVAVLRGRTQVGDPQTSLTINAGETAFIQPGNPPLINVQATAATPFDNWSLERDNFEEPRQVTRYVSQEMTGYEDLDRYGTWQPDPTYGNVWIPTEVPVGWQPYHYGHWVFVSPWGWTWIDEAPWGFAPFHYGRWAYVHNHWGWVPGHVVRHPVYAPALVAFIGGSGFSVSISTGERPVGWFPLGPNEAYRPGYHVSRNYVRNVNVTNVKNINDVDHDRSPHGNFANRRFATVVPAKDFAASRPVDKAAIPVSAAKLASAPVAATATPPVPLQHRAPDQNTPHGNYIHDMHGPDRRAGDQQRNNNVFTNRPAALQQPTVPNSPTPPAQPNMGTVHTGHEQPAPQSRTETAQPHREQAAPAVVTAPGPPIEHHNRPYGYQPSMHVNPAAATPLASPATAPATIEPAHEHEQRHEQPHEAIHQSTVNAPVVNAPTPPQTPVIQAAPLVEMHQERERPQHMEPIAQPRQMPHELDLPRPQQAAPLVPSHEGWVRKAPEAARPAEAPHVAQPHPAPHVEAPHVEPPHPTPAAETPHADHGSVVSKP